MKDFLIGAGAFAVVLGIAIGGLILLLVCNPFFWLAVIAFILATKL